MNKLLLLMLVLGCWMLSACQQKNSQSNHPDTRVAEVSSAALKTTKDAKPGAKVRLASSSIVTLAAAKTTSIEILLNAQVDDGNMHVELNPSEGLQLLGDKASYDFTNNVDGQYKLKVDLYAANDGRYYLNLHTGITAGDASSSRSLAVIVQVGAVTAIDEQPTKALQKASGEKVISLPAEERITTQ